MAGADYKTCDNCGGKSYYDADLHWDFDEEDKPNGLWNLGDISALCMECAKTHKCVVVAMDMSEVAARQKEWADHAERVRAIRARRSVKP